MRPTIILPDGALSPSGLWLPRGYADKGSEQPPRLTLDTAREDGLAIVTRAKGDAMGRLLRAVPHERDLGLETTSLDELCELVGELPFDTAMVLFARLAAEAWHVGADHAGQLTLAREILPRGAPILDAIDRFLNANDGGAVIFEQQLFALMRLTLEHGRSGGVDEADPAAVDQFSGPALRSLFAASSVVTDSIEELPGDDRDRKKWLAVLIQNANYNTKTAPINSFSRALRLLELADRGDVGEPQDRCDVAAWLSEDYGLTPQEQFACGLVLAGLSGALDEDRPVDELSLVSAARLDALLEQLSLHGRRDAVLELLSAPREWYVDQFASGEGSAMDVAWRRTPFEARPFLRWGDGHLLLLSPRALLGWLGEGFHHRTFACAARRGKAVRERYSRYFGQLVEEYALELTKLAYPAPAALPRVHGEQRYGKGGGSKTSDIAVDCAPDLVLFEVAGGRLTELTRTEAGWEAVERDLNKLVLARIRKLDGCIRALKEGRAALPGVESKGIRHIWPVIVTAGDVPQSQLLREYIDANSGEALRQPGVKPLTLLDLDDFELLLGMVEGGASLVEILERKASSSFHDLSLLHWRNQDPEAPPEQRPTIVDQRMKIAFAELAERLGLDPNALPDPADR